MYYPLIVRRLCQNISKTTYGTKMRDVYVNVIFRRSKPQKWKHRPNISYTDFLDIS